MARPVLFYLLCCLPICSIFAQSLPIDSLPSQGVLLEKGWTFHAGDNPEWAKTGFNDSKWEAILPTNDIKAIPQLWKTERGWFRLRFSVDSAMAWKSLAILVQQTGASEIFLNGELIGQFGEFSDRSHPVRAATPANNSFIGMPIKAPGEQVLAVRFALQRDLPYIIFADRPNTALSLRLMETSTIGRYVQSDITPYFDFLRAGIYLLLFIIHLALFWFSPAQKPNLYFLLYAAFNSLYCILIGLLYEHAHWAATKMSFLIGLLVFFLAGQLFF